MNAISLSCLRIFKLQTRSIVTGPYEIHRDLVGNSTAQTTDVAISKSAINKRCNLQGNSLIRLGQYDISKSRSSR